MDDKSFQDVHRVKRFKHQSYNQSLKDVHLPAAYNQRQVDSEIGDNESHFHEALNNWTQLNLAPSFIRFANKADSLSASMPLLLHNWKEIVDLWIEAFDVSDDEGLRPLLDLLQKLAHDLRTTLAPIYTNILNRLLKLLPRPIDAAALTALLETFSVLFKFLLVPSIHLELLEATWDSVRLMLPKCLPEVQRAMAEVWGSVLRRLKTTPRARAVNLLARKLEGVEDASAWVIVYACKSVSQTLHTATTSIFTPLLAYHMTSGAPEPTYTLIRRVLTALIHHVKNAGQFSPLADLLVEQFKTLAKSMDSGSPDFIESLRRMVEVISVPTAVRQGSRLTQSHLSALFAETVTFPIVPALHPALLKFTTSILTASEMPLWVGAGLKFLQYAWGTQTDALDNGNTNLQFALKVNGCLAELGWGGWKLVGLPLTLKMCVLPAVLEAEPRGVLELLAALRRGKKLNAGDADLVWRTKLEKWAIGRLEVWEIENVRGSAGEKAVELNDILTLSTFFSGALSPILVDIVERMLSKVENEKLASFAWALGACMKTLAKRDVSEWSDKVDLASWTRACLGPWAWSHDVIAGLHALSQTSSASAGVPLDEVYPSLQKSLLSHSRSLRLNALRLLQSNLIEAPAGQQEVIKRCLQGEEVSLDVQGVRERVLRIGRVGQVLRDGDETGADLCARWLIAQLKVNLRPLWSPAAGALASLSQRFGDVVWRLLFGELQLLGQGQQHDVVQQWLESTQEMDGGVDGDPWEEEKSWRDPSAHNIRSVVLKWMDTRHAQAELVKAQCPQEHLDLQSYEFQLLSALGECPAVAEKHNRDLVPHFLSLADPNAPSKVPKQKLTAWLNLFAKFSNPKALFSTEILRTLYISLLSHPDRTLQKAALNCIFAYKSSHLASHEDKIRILLDDTRWRDELASLDFDLIEPQDRGEVVDVILRLLFGLMLEKKGRSRGADRRAAVLGTLGCCTNKELGLLVDLMLQPLGSTCTARREQPFTVVIVDPGVSDKQQMGFLTLLGDVLRNLGPRLVDYWPALLGTTIDLVASAQTRVESPSGHEEEEEEIGEGEDGDDTAEDMDGPTSSSKIVRSIRQLGLKRFADFFRCPMSFDYSPYMEAVFAAFISPRLSALDKENTQAPSALMELFYSWSLEEAYTGFLVQYDSRVLPKVYDCLVAPSVKPAVVSRIFDIVESLLAASFDNQGICDAVVKPHISLLLSNLAALVQRTKDVSAVATPLAQRQINILSEIAQYCTDASQASTLLGLFTPLLRKPPKLVPEKVKVDLLKIIGQLMPLIPGLADRTSDVYRVTFRLLSQLFQSLRSRAARLGLVSVFQRLATSNTSLQALSALLVSLDAYSSKRVDEPDFDTRLSGFALLNETLHETLLCEDWLPVLYDMLHFIQDPVELAIRNNASFAMRHFVDIVSSQSSSEYDSTFLRILFPGLKNGLRTKNELVRAEVLGVIAYAVSRCDHINALQEMKVLLAGGDEEANFFNNVLHIQVHRRSRALRRLADYCDEGRLRSTTLAEIFVPLVGNYIDATSSIDHHLVNDAILTTGRMAKHLAWGAYYTLVQKYLKLCRAKDTSERVYVRTLVSLLDNFHFPMEDIAPEAGDAQESDDDVEEGVVQDHTTADVLSQPVSSSQTARIADAVNQRLLPSLLNHLEKHDATTDDNARIPISIGIVNVAKHLPLATREPQINRLVTVLAQILRSRSQETRDLTRDTLNRIAVILGPSHLPMIIREERGALLRGPQLHVLASVVHALLVHVTNGDNAQSFGTLDGCVNDVAHVSAEVIFGESGKDVQHEDFKTKMREVRSSSSKGLDSFAIVARCITPPKISSLLLPLRSIMQETESAKIMLLVEEVLKRISSGLNSNKHLVPSELLALCNTLISQNAKFLKQTPLRRKSRDKGDAIVQVKRQEAIEVDHYANNSFRFVVFGLELFNSALRRNRFDFHDLAIIARLDAMIVVVGDTLYSTSAPVLVLGMRAAAGIVNCPLKSLEKSIPVFVQQIIDIIKQTGNTESEVVQVALKSLASILRDGGAVEVKEKDLVYLLELLSPDLEDPSRQGAVFAMLRAIVARKFVVPEIYDIMDKVSEILVTSQSPQVQELCRGVFLQFLLDYPQGKGRLRNQMTFLAKNLSYVYESGRKSVMELLSAIVSKFQVDLILEYADLLFVALVMVVANDDSAKCREMASALIKSLFTRLDDDRRRVILSHLHSWASQHSQPQLSRVSSQVYGFVIDVLATDSLPYITIILEDVNTALQRSAQEQTANEGGELTEASMQVDLEWQTPYHALTVLSKILRVFPDYASHESRVAWNLVVPHLLYPHAWVRTASCRLFGLLFTAITIQPPRSNLADDNPLSLTGMRDIAMKLCLQLKSEHLDEALSLQVVKNLFYLGKCFYAIPVADLPPEDGNFEETNEEIEKDSKSLDPLPWLFSKLSYQIKSAHIERRNRRSGAINWSQQPLAALRWFAAMGSHMDPKRLEKFLVHILTPVYRLREDETIRDPQIDELKMLATELQDLLQSKVGTTKFSATYNQIRQSAVGIRRERKTAKVLLMTTNPEAAAKRKLQRNSIKRESRKRKDRGFADGKGKLKRRREE